MPKKLKKQPAAGRRYVLKQPTMDQLRAFVRSRGDAFLDDPNINSIGIGEKVTKGKRGKELAIQFTVNQKLETANQIEAAGSTPIPKQIDFEGVKIPTDVIERQFKACFELVALEQKSVRKQRVDPMRPGVSVSHPSGTAGTLGLIVYDQHSGAACILSNWHVLNTPSGQIGDAIVQPGPYDDNRVDQNKAGTLLRSHLGIAGDCAIAKIEGRGFDLSVLDLNVTARELGKAEIGDLVVKSGRTTDVTYGRVRRTDTITKLTYGSTGEQRIGGFEIGPADDHPADNHQISMGGDSGSAWLGCDRNGKPSRVLLGLHFAGEPDGDSDDHAMACYAHAVFEKLEIAFDEPAQPQAVQEVAARGYDPKFLGPRVDVPEPTTSSDVYDFRGSNLIPYTHFSVCLSTARKMPRFVAWNIDGSELKAYGRKGLDFTVDPRVEEKYQAGNELYEGNKLDRGHIARRADLVWGPATEAQRANRDSFFYTNITPQHQAFNQSQRAGLWGLLENAIFEDVDVDDLRVSLFGGPIFKTTDMEYRGYRIPAAFWKVIAYLEATQLRAKAYVLTQDDLLNDIEALELDSFKLYQVSLDEVEKRAKLKFSAGLKAADSFVPEALAEGVSRRRALRVREVTSREELVQ